MDNSLSRKSIISKDAMFNTANLEAATKANIQLLNESFQRLESAMEGKVNIVLESFSTLRMLVSGQADLLGALSSRVTKLQEENKELKDDLKATFNSFKQLNDSLKNGSPVSVNERSPRPSSAAEVKASLKRLLLEPESSKEILEQICHKTPHCFCHNATLISIQSEMALQKQTQMMLTSSVALHEERRKRDAEAVARLADELQNIEVGQKAINDSVENTKNELVVISEKIQDTDSQFANRKGSVGEGMCVFPYKKIGEQCFYVNNEERLDWDSARRNCVGLQGDLATPSHMPPFKQFLQDKKIGRGQSFWLGATFSSPDNEWVWLDGRGVNQTLTTWMMSHRVADRGATCLTIVHGVALSLNNAACAQNKFFVCQQSRLV